MRNDLESGETVNGSNSPIKHIVCLNLVGGRAPKVFVGIDENNSFSTSPNAPMREETLHKQIDNVQTRQMIDLIVNGMQVCAMCSNKAVMFGMWQMSPKEIWITGGTKPHRATWYALCHRHQKELIDTGARNIENFVFQQALTNGIESFVVTGNNVRDQFIALMDWVNGKQEELPPPLPYKTRQEALEALESSACPNSEFCADLIARIYKI